MNSKAGLEPFKRVHPYCAVDEAAFLKWPIGKQRAAEVSSRIKSLLPMKIIFKKKLKSLDLYM